MSALTHFTVSEGVAALAPSAYALFDTSSQTGIVGWPQVVMSLTRTVVKMEEKARHADTAALDRMIDIARGLVPVDTGRLLSGIGGENYDDYSEFRASAVHETGNTADYARFVEFGTRGGERGARSEITSFEGGISLDPDRENATFLRRGTAKVKTRRSLRTHSGTAARPFFFPAANQVLGDRARDAESWGDDAASGEGFE
ncbi:MAG: HK97 gp10 family phage protein [Methylocystis sp.]